MSADRYDVVLVPGLCAGIKRSDSSKSSVSLGILSLGSYLGANGFSVRIVNLDQSIQAGNLTLGADFHDQLAAHLLELRGGVYGFYVAVGLLHYVVEAATRIKAARPEALVVVGGPHASSAHEKIIATFPEIDAVFRGESERSFLAFCRAARRGGDLDAIPGTTVRRGAGVGVNPDAELIADMDDIPTPDYSLYQREDSDKDVVSVDAGRGCPHLCNFCSTSLFWKRTNRVKSIDRLVADMRHARREWGAKKIFLMHDCLTANRAYVDALCVRLAELSFPVPWGCATRLDHLRDRSLLDRLQEGGCNHLELGIESGSPAVRRFVKKPLGSNGEIVEMVRELRRRGFAVVMYYICGFPEETPEQMEETLNLIGETAVALKGAGFFRLSPLEVFPDTHLSQTHLPRLGFNEERIAPPLRSVYSPRCRAMARREPTLFPEFHYIPNRHGVDDDRILDIASLYNGMGRILTIEFHNLIRYLDVTCGMGLKQVAGLWRAFEEERGDTRLSGAETPDALDDFLAYLHRRGRLPRLDVAQDILAYELVARRCRQVNLFRHEPDAPSPPPTRPIRPRLSPTVRIVRLRNDIVRLLKDLEAGVTPVADSRPSVVAALPVTTEQVRMVKLNGVADALIGRCDGARTLPELIREIIAAGHLAAEAEADGVAMGEKLLAMGILCS